MNSFDTLIFPDTDVFKEKYHPLLLFCSPLHFLQLVVPDPKVQPIDETAHFYQHGLWQPHLPAPLGINRGPFSAWIDDIKSHQKYYIDQVAAPAITAHPEQQDELVISLLKKRGFATKDIEDHLELWRSRLILSIAEIVDNEEDDLQEELSYFNEEEIAALGSLKTEDDSVEGYLVEDGENFTGQPGKPDLIESVARFDAWLYLMQQEPLPAVRLWLASTRAAAEQILQRYKSLSGRHAVPLLKLVLPATISASGKYVVEQIESFHRATTFIHRGLVADFTRITTTVPYMPDSPDSLLPYGTDWADQWETILYDAFPAKKDGRTALTFYLLPDQPVAGLFALSATVKKEEDPDDKAAHGLLAVLGPA